MRRLVVTLGVVFAALVLDPAASAHPRLSPAFVERGTASDLLLTAPNERRVPMTALELTVPPTVQLLAAASLPGWRGTIDGNRARWSGGSLGPGKRKQFPVGLLASGAPGETSLSVSQRFADGRSVDWQVMLLVTPGAEAEPGRRSWWITVAAVAAVAVAGAVLVALLRPRRGESD